MKFKCNECGYSIASIYKEEGYSVEHCHLNDFPPNSEIWDKDWRLYCFYGVDNKCWIDFYLVCNNCGKRHGPQTTYNKLVNHLKSIGILT
jgi:hypothetical protein